MEGSSGSVDSVVFVLRFCHSRLSAIGSHSFLVGDDGVVLDDLTLSVVLLEIVEANFNVEFTTSGDDVLSALVVFAYD
jgi:hypothetical protein